MIEKEIFERLFSIFNQSDDTEGIVAACLVRKGMIVSEAVSNNDGVHAEYALLKKLESSGEVLHEEDVVYTTVEPCGKRSPGGRGEKMGDCTSNLLKAGAKHVVYAASDPHASEKTRHKFDDAGVVCRQIKDRELIAKAINLFNSTCQTRENWLPLQ
jgi:pyrimidine deaminase RibD-like protein